MIAEQEEAELQAAMDAVALKANEEQEEKKDEWKKITRLFSNEAFLFLCNRSFLISFSYLHDQAIIFGFSNLMH